jgi:hypothetical protein
MLKKDSMILGIFLGALIPVVAFGIIYGINILISKIFTNGYLIFTLPTVFVLSIFVNVLIFRYYMLKLKKDYTGRGILLATFVYAFVYFFKFW